MKEQERFVMSATAHVMLGGNNIITEIDVNNTLAMTNEYNASKG
jgi:hypothetical protein